MLKLKSFCVVITTVILLTLSSNSFSDDSVELPINTKASSIQLDNVPEINGELIASSDESLEEVPTSEEETAEVTIESEDDSEEISEE